MLQKVRSWFRETMPTTKDSPIDLTNCIDHIDDCGSNIFVYGSAIVVVGIMCLLLLGLFI